MTERKLKKALEEQTPDILDAILAECGQEDDDWQVVKLPEKRRPWIGIVSAAAILALVLGFGWLAWKGKPESALKDPTELTKTTTPIDIDLETVVTDAYRGSWNGYEYAIPQINLDSSYAKVVNAEIRRSYFPDEDGVVREERNLSYEYFIDGDILSLVYYIPDYTTVYNLRLSDGSKAEREIVLAQAGVSIESYLQQLFWNLTNTYCKENVDSEELPYIMIFGSRAQNLDSTEPFLREDGLHYLALIHEGDTARREIFRYGELVQEAENYRENLKVMFYQGTMASLSYPIASGTYKDEDGEIQTNVFNIVLLDGEDAAEANRELLELYAPYLDENGDIVSTVIVNSWECSSGDVVSIYVSIEDGENVICRTYNFDLDDSSLIENAEVLALHGVTKEEFRQNVRPQLIDYYCCETQEDLSSITELSPELLRTLSDENIDLATPHCFSNAWCEFIPVYLPGQMDWTGVHFDEYEYESPYTAKMLALYEAYLTGQPVDPHMITPLQIKTCYVEDEPVFLSVQSVQDGLVFENAEGKTLNFNNPSDSSDEYIRVSNYSGGIGSGKLTCEIPYSPMYTISGNIDAEDFNVIAKFGEISTSIKGSGIEKIVFGMSGVELFGTDMTYTIRSNSEYTDEESTEVIGSGEAHIKMERCTKGFFVHATQACMVRELSHCYPQDMELACKRLAPLTPYEAYGEYSTELLSTPIEDWFTNTITRKYEGNDYTFRCTVPHVASESAYANQINEEMRLYYISCEDEEYNWTGVNASYEYYINGDILSLIVHMHDMEKLMNFEFDRPHRIYNIRISDGSKVSAEEVLQAAGVSKADFRERAKQILGNDFITRSDDERIWQSVLADPEGHSFLPVFAKTVSEENLDCIVPYLTENGELHFMARSYHVAGGFEYETPLYSYADEFEVSPYYEDMIKLS